jgi:hypothetical protein
MKFRVGDKVKAGPFGPWKPDWLGRTGTITKIEGDNPTWVVVYIQWDHGSRSRKDGPYAIDMFSMANGLERVLSDV